MTAVSCVDVTKVFGRGESRTTALRGATLEAVPGELTVIVGPSGSGKSTLLSVIAGLLAPTSGHVTVLGRDLAALDDRERTIFRRENLGFVFQQFQLLPALDAAENAAVPLLAAGVPLGRALERARDLLARVGLGEHLRHRPGQLSGGQQQRVALARALVNDPALVICDEPTSALDAENGRQALELLASIALQATRAVLVVTHDARVLSFADRIVRVDDGRVAATEAGPRATRRPGGRPCS